MLSQLAKQFAQVVCEVQQVQVLLSDVAHQISHFALPQRVYYVVFPEDSLEYPQEEIFALLFSPLGLINLKQFIQTLRAVDISMHLFIFYSELFII